MTVSARGIGRSKVILLGEHSVVYGQPALAAALGLGVRVRAEQAERPSLAVPAWGVEVGPGEADDLSRVFAALLAEAPPAVRSARLIVDPEVPSRAGLGSSAALAVAMIRALASLSGETLSDDEVERRAGLAETIFHGRASGIDAAVACRGGALRFVRGEPPRSVGCPLLPAVVAQVEPRSPTSEMVALVGRALEAEPDRIGAIFAEIGVLVDSAVSRLEAGDLTGLGGLMGHNHRLLRELGVSTEALDDGCHAALAAGAVGAKLTGAGGGGCLIALAPGCDEAVEAALSPRSLWVRRVLLGS